MDPDLFKVFAQEFAAEWNRLQAETESSLDRVRSEHERVCRQIDRLVDALADGEPAARLKNKLRELERRRLELERDLTTAKAPAPRLHPNVAEVFRRKVEELHNALEHFQVWRNRVGDSFFAALMIRCADRIGARDDHGRGLFAGPSGAGHGGG